MAQDDYDENYDKLEVNINSNFNMLTAFGSFPIVQLMEKHIFEIMFPAIKHYFNLRLPIKQEQIQDYDKFFVMLQRAVSFAKKDSHFEASRDLFQALKGFP